MTVTIVGSGSVTSVPSGLSCANATCSAAFPRGWQISLYAAAASGWTLGGWKGPCVAVDNRCDLNTNDVRVVTVTFVR